MTTPFRIYTVTYNVKQKPPPADLTKLLKLDEGVLPNLYAISLQEIKATVGAHLADAVYDDAWSNALSFCLQKHKFVRVKTLRLQGMHSSVFIRRADLPYISNIESEFTRTGIAGLWGNKGGISIRMDISGTNVCFVNCHLPAHLPNVPERIEAYDSIVDSQKFRDESVDSLLDHDYVFWMGDLNFRLDDIPREEVIKRAEAMDLDHLLAYDQLRKAMKDDLIFIDFHEGPLTFAPTYRFDQGTDTYDTGSKQRKPAWCDRILWLVHEDAFEGVELSVQQLFYKSLPEYRTSDHKPVASEFVIQVLRNPPELPVMFEPIDTWCSTKSQNCVFSVFKAHYTVSASDWIGLYKADYRHPRDYQTYMWVVTEEEDNYDGSCNYEVKCDKYYLKDLEGQYTLCYFSKKKNCVIGYSDTFKISPTEESSSSSSSSSEQSSN